MAYKYAPNGVVKFGRLARDRSEWAALNWELIADSAEGYGLAGGSEDVSGVDVSSSIGGAYIIELRVGGRYDRSLRAHGSGVSAGNTT